MGSSCSLCTLHRELITMGFTEEQRELLGKFQSKFTIRSTSLAIQDVEITEHGSILYSNTNVYGDTSSIDIFDKRIGFLVATIEHPQDDLQALLQFIRKWQEQGYPMPEDDTDLFIK